MAFIWTSSLFFICTYIYSSLYVFVFLLKNTHLSYKIYSYVDHWRKMSIIFETGIKRMTKHDVLLCNRCGFFFVWTCFVINQKVIETYIGEEDNHSETNNFILIKYIYDINESKRWRPMYAQLLLWPYFLFLNVLWRTTYKC